MPLAEVARVDLPQRNPAAVMAEVTDGAVVYLPSSELYFGLSPVAAIIWQLLPPACGTMHDLCAALASRYPDVPTAILQQDAEELLRELERRELVGVAGPT